MGFTTTFLGLGDQANRLFRGERVCLVIKTRYKSRAVASESSVSAKASSKKKAPKEPKQPKATGAKASKASQKTTGVAKSKVKKSKKTKASSASDEVEDLSDDFDDVVEVVTSTGQYPLMPATHAVGRYVSAYVRVALASRPHHVVSCR